MKHGDVVLSPELYDRFQKAYVSLSEALSEARPYVYNVAEGHRDNWRGQTARDVLSRVDAALSMRSENL